MNRSSMNHHISLLLLIWGLCAATSISKAQTIIQTPAQADSLRRVIATAKHDTTRVGAMNELSNYFWYSKSQLDSAMTYAQEAHNMAVPSYTAIGAGFESEFETLIKLPNYRHVPYCRKDQTYARTKNSAALFDLSMKLFNIFLELGILRMNMTINPMTFIAVQFLSLVS